MRLVSLDGEAAKFVWELAECKVTAAQERYASKQSKAVTHDEHAAELVAVGDNTCSQQPTSLCGTWRRQAADAAGPWTAPKAGASRYWGVLNMQLRRSLVK